MPGAEPPVTDAIPIFPLRTVLYPGGPLKLRIFEARYLDMVSRCLRDDLAFGVCLIRSGEETGAPAEPYPVGTTARIVDWDRQADGLLGVIAMGGERFRMLSAELGGNGLLWARVEPLPTDPCPPLPQQPPELARLLDEVLSLPGRGYEHGRRLDQDADWLSCRLAEILPLSLDDRQRLLLMNDPMERLRVLAQVLPAVRLDTGAD